jgi:hypothetical protein
MGKDYFSNMAVIPSSSSPTYIHPEQLAKALGGEARGDRVLAPGPGHSPKDRSLSIKVDPNAPDGFVVHSFAGDDPIDCKDHVRDKAGLGSFQPSRPNGNPGKKHVATYSYRDHSGALLYQVLRYAPKGFSQRHRGPDGEWINEQAERSVLYRWPEIIKYPDASIFVVEGEKDADRVAKLGHCATTIDGRGRWGVECVQALKDRHIFILQDNDEPRRR